MSSGMEGDGMVKISKVETGKKIRKLLADYGITVRDVQEELELDSPQSVYKWLNGKALPSLDNLLVLGSMLDMPVEQILVLEGTEDGEVLKRRMRWIKKHPPVMRGYKFTGQKRMKSYSIMILDTKTDWKPEGPQDVETEIKSSDPESPSDSINPEADCRKH